MATTIRLTLVVDRQGRVLAAQLPARSEGKTSQESPAAELLLGNDHRAVSIVVPRDMLDLPGPDLHRFFGEVRIRPNGEAQLPKIKVQRAHAK